MFFIKFPDPTAAKKQDEAYLERLLAHEYYETHKTFIDSNTWDICEATSKDLLSLMYRCMFAHVFCFFITLYREVYEAKLQTLGQIMRAMEILAVVVYFDVVFAGVTQYTQWLMRAINFEDVLFNIGHNSKAELEIYQRIMEPTCFSQSTAEG